MGTSPHHPVTLICDMEATHSKHNRTRNAQNIAPTTRPWQTAHLHLPFIDCQQLQDIRTQPASQRCVQGEEGQLHTSRLWGLHVYLRWRVGGHDWHIWGEGKIFIPISMMQGPQGHLVVHALFDYIIHHMVNICGRCPKKQPHKHTPRPIIERFKLCFNPPSNSAWTTRWPCGPCIMLIGMKIFPSPQICQSCPPTLHLRT